MSTLRIRKIINYFDCIFGNDCCNAIDRISEQETQLSLTYRATQLYKYNGAADLLKTCPSREVLPITMPILVVLRYRVYGQIQENSNNRKAITPLSWDKRRRSSPHVLLCQIWEFCDKRCTHKFPKLLSAGTRSPSGWAWLIPKNKPPPHMCYHVEIRQYCIKRCMHK